MASEGGETGWWHRGGQWSRVSRRRARASCSALLRCSLELDSMTAAGGPDLSKLGGEVEPGARWVGRWGGWAGSCVGMRGPLFQEVDC